MADATRLITAAISVGVPRFNGGDAAGCASVYSDAIANLLALEPNHAPQLMAALEQASSQRSASDRAWVLRHALDDTLATLRGGGGGSGSGAAPEPSSSAALALGSGLLRWAAVDDRVMGGSSRSTMRALDDGSASFEGTLVIAGGGFASVRALPSQPLRWANAAGLVLTYAGDGRSGYKLVLKTDEAMDGIMYQTNLPAPSGAMASVRLPFSAFAPNFRGRAVPNAPPLRGEDVRQIGFMLSRFDIASGGVTASVAAGAFGLRLARLEAYY